MGKIAPRNSMWAGYKRTKRTCQVTEVWEIHHHWTTDISQAWCSKTAQVPFSADMFRQWQVHLSYLVHRWDECRAPRARDSHWNMNSFQLFSWKRCHLVLPALQNGWKERHRLRQGKCLTRMTFIAFPWPRRVSMHFGWIVWGVDSNKGDHTWNSLEILTVFRVTLLGGKAREEQPAFRSPLQNKVQSSLCL